MILSIIVPVYNVEKYVERCLDSIYNQDISKDTYEIIVVNDGSTDNSLAVVSDFAANRQNVVLINQENQGLSAARNKGLSNAQGDFVWFVDSDDWIDKDCLSAITNNLSDNPDVLQMKYTIFYEDTGKTETKKQMYLEGIYSGEQITKMGGLPDPAPFAIYRREFLNENKISFLKGIYHEDAEFKPRVTYHAKKIKFLDRIVYYYRKRSSGSITSKFTIKNGRDYLLVCKRHCVMGENFRGNLRVGLANRIGMTLNSILGGFQRMKKEEQVLFVKELEESKSVFRYVLCSNKPKYKIEAMMLILNTSLALKLYRLIK